MNDKIKLCFEQIKSYYENINDCISAEMYQAQALVTAREIAKESGLEEIKAYPIFNTIRAAVEMQMSVSSLERILREFRVV